MSYSDSQSTTWHIYVYHQSTSLNLQLIDVALCSGHIKYQNLHLFPERPSCFTIFNLHELIFHLFFYFSKKKNKTKHLSFSDCIQVFLSTSSRSSSSWRTFVTRVFFPAKSKRYTVLVSPTWGLVISTFLLKLQLTLPASWKKTVEKKGVYIPANMLVTWLKNQHRHFHGRMSTFATDPLHCSASFHVKRWPFRGFPRHGKEGLSWVFWKLKKLALKQEPKCLEILRNNKEHVWWS